MSITGGNEMKGKQMNNVNSTILRLWEQEEGLTAVEYAVAGGLIAAATVVAFQTLGITVTGVITGINTALAG
jgi:pilus assembly protein Flp/PilA